MKKSAYFFENVDNHLISLIHKNEENKKNILFSVTVLNCTQFNKVHFRKEENITVGRIL